MINNKIIVLGLILLLVGEIGLSQTSNKKDYVVVTFELSQKKPSGNQNYYWITPIDSIINKSVFNIYPLYMEEYSNDSFEKCLKGDTVDVFTTTTETNYDFREKHLSELNIFQSIIKQNRMLVQELRLNWNSKTKGTEKLNIYLTPIKGQFCDCIQRTEVWGKSDLNFLILTFMPVSSFEYDSDFWKTELGKILQISDFSKVDFTSHLPSDIYGRYVSKAKIVIKSARPDL